MIEKTQEISFKKVPSLYWFFFLLFLILSAIILWQCYLPFAAERHYRDGYQFSATNRIKWAAEELELACEYAPWETQYKIQLGKHYEDLFELETDQNTKLVLLKKAENIYQDAFNLEPINPWYANRIAVVNSLYFQLFPNQIHYLQTAEQFTKKASELDTQNPLFVLNYASFLHRYNRIKEAKELYERIIVMDDAIYEAQYNIADIYKREGNIAKCLELYTNIYNKNPNFNNICLAIASIYLQTGGYPKAIEFLEEALSKNPQQKEPLKSLASLYAQNRDWPKVLRSYQAFLAYFPDSKSEIHLAYVQALSNTGYLDIAQTEVDQFLSLNPNHEIALKIKGIIQENILKSRGSH